MTDTLIFNAEEIEQSLLPAKLATGIDYSSFALRASSGHGFNAWQERMSPVYDIEPFSKGAESSFHADMSRFTVDNLSLFDFNTGKNRAVRSLGRVSTEAINDITLSVFLSGGAELAVGPRLTQVGDAAPSVFSVLALDMSQPVTVESFDSRLLLIFVPRAVVEKTGVEAAALHGRTLAGTTPSTRLAIENLIALNRNIVGMSKTAVYNSLLAIAHLLVQAVSPDTFSGDARASMRAVAYASACRYIESNMQDPDLTPEHVVAWMGLSRATAYRIFEHDGGLAAYIRRRRLLQAAKELVSFPGIAVQDVAYSVGFENLASFSRAFHRTFDIVPTSLREYARAHGRRFENHPGHAWRVRAR